MVRALSVEMRTVREEMSVVRVEMREFREAFGIMTGALECIMRPDQPPFVPALGDPNSERDSNQHPINWYSETQMDADFAMNFAATSPSDPTSDLNPQPHAGGSPYQFPLNPTPYSSTAFESGWVPAPGASQARLNDSTSGPSSQANSGTAFSQGSSQGQTARETREVWENDTDWIDEESRGEVE